MWYVVPHCLKLCTSPTKYDISLKETLFYYSTEAPLPATHLIILFKRIVFAIVFSKYTKTEQNLDESRSILPIAFTIFSLTNNEVSC